MPLYVGTELVRRAGLPAQNTILIAAQDSGTRYYLASYLAPLSCQIAGKIAGKIADKIAGKISGKIAGKIAWARPGGAPVSFWRIGPLPPSSTPGNSHSARPRASTQT